MGEADELYVVSVPRPFRLSASGRNKIHPSIHGLAPQMCKKLRDCGGHSVVGPCPTISCTQLPLAFPPPDHHTTSHLYRTPSPRHHRQKVPSGFTGLGLLATIPNPQERAAAVCQQILHASVLCCISPGSRSPACS
ncbi:hypothetical protein N658DRAFT_345787 [Parathielavia hyrcaniae]|uniref:Uncharacterized protein n=1 Tax=Parathielavia hyrcaniae TaxID=113614 RepID=A0AAN6PV67_9PEZI|nr:hypothetical protein N658DRAFT_345787 [Parathielavia hyrcaniae]